jgi:NAD(P)H-hydrate repair Nnr-like enzyme with NAD(P)H-hydrate dehydratase domain
MLLIGGTVPCDIGQLIIGEAYYEKGDVRVCKSSLPVSRGTAALVGAAAITCRYLGLEPPHVLLAGDIGQKTTGTIIYESLQAFLEKTQVHTLTLHYLMPNIRYHKALMKSIQELDPKPILIADAGSMYVAKAAGQAALYDLFTPDLGELAFLADDQAAHPAYTRGFICHMEEDVPELIRRAFEYKNTARYLCVKGKIDYICHDGVILDRIDEPSIESLEAIGGTGDTLTGIASALIYKGLDIHKACLSATKANRWAGKLSNPTPATQIREIIDHIPEALNKV